MKKVVIDKQTHIESGKQIKIIVGSCFDRIYEQYAKNIVGGSIHTITERPDRKARKNGDMGVWVQGTDEEKVFVRFFGCVPYFPIITKQMVRTKNIRFRRTKPPVFKRTK